ncbi:uncharacterized protein LOC107367963 [Tetranychus urticae]|nr:uncharacterized protein LOC107367963 [Tetranychus urticae]
MAFFNPFSSSSSFGPIGTPLSKSSSELTRKLKSHPDPAIQSIPMNVPPTLVSNHNTSKRKSRRGSCVECVFCKNNGQPVNFYQSHTLKDTLGRVVCPILFAYDCPICHNGGGPQAHTVRYCPENKPSAKLENSPVNRVESNLLIPQDTLLAQFLRLYLDNQQSTSYLKLNYLSSSSSFGSNGSIDPIGTPFSKSSPEFTRKLKARQETAIQSIPMNVPPTPVSNHNTSRRKSRRGSCVECVFCKNNGQPVSFYQSHVLKDTLGRVVCPILFAYDCPICHNGGGPQAHTIRYCPENKPSNRLRNALLKSQALLNSGQSIL